MMERARKPFPTPQGRIGRDEVRARCERAMQRGLPTDMHCINTAREWAVIGGGPSIKDEVDTIRALKRRGVAIVSVNKSHDWLLEHGITPWGHVLLDPKEWVAGYVKRPRKDVRYFVASQCHDSVFDVLEGYPVFLWHAGQDFEDGTTEPDAYLRERWTTANWRIVPGPTTVGLRVPFLGHHMPDGPNTFHMFGMDSSRMNGAMHAYDKPEPPDAAKGKQILRCRGTNYTFQTNSHMARQFEDFGNLMDNLADHYEHGRLRKSFKLKFYGYGLLPFYAAMLGLHARPEFNQDPAKVGGYLEPDHDFWAMARASFKLPPLPKSLDEVESISVSM